MMKKVFLLKNLGCAHCASKMEDKIAKLKGVDEVTINFLTTKMIIEAAEVCMPEIIASIGKIINKLEPDVEIIEN